MDPMIYKGSSHNIEYHPENLCSKVSNGTGLILCLCHKSSVYDLIKRFSTLRRHSGLDYDFQTCNFAMTTDMCLCYDYGCS